MIRRNKKVRAGDRVRSTSGPDVLGTIREDDVGSTLVRVSFDGSRVYPDGVWIQRKHLVLL